MRGFISILPAAIFFGVYVYTGDFMNATAALVCTIPLMPLLLKICGLEIRKMEWITVGLVLVFGGISLLLRESIYLQIKTTIINWLFAGVFLAMDYGFRKNLARALLGEFYSAADIEWRRVSNILAGVFVFIGALNIAVIYTQSEETWVWIKTFIYPGISFAGIIAALVYLAYRGAPISEDNKS